MSDERKMILTMLAEGKISAEDLDLLILTDSPDEVRDVIVRAQQDREWRRQQEEGARQVAREAYGRR